ncbi:O-antigen ligase family protein [Sphingomonas sp. CBMAI 2297]|uniref:O-antigen ligase family protein n=1 Tax=Sphingomonas sp. CBMAI 2297 TaxID=2991720 RepID=UPI00245551E6|nr:O-antigen ligase family protein [Sphingomonas sp. CBMAI 2297]MDH4742996.1 O-antigen ligase family protein [Sphingomonas sp. CBMAI 2297]
MSFPSRLRPDYLAAAALFLLLVTIAALFGGASRMDVPVVTIVRIAAIIAGAFAVVFVPFEGYRVARGPLLLLGALIAYMLLQILPLPPFVWRHLPGHEPIAAVADAIGTGQSWLAISISPLRTWNSLCAALVPAGTLLVLCALARSQREIPLWTLIGVGLVSGVLGLMQIVSPAGSPLYLYEITNENSAVGFFANRNHQAVLLVSLFPMLGAFVTMPQNARARLPREMLAMMAALFLIPLVLVTGSRAGLLLMPIGILAGLLIALPRIRDLPRKYFLIGGAAAVVAVAALIVAVVLQSRAQALTRLLASHGTGELRYEVLHPVWNMAVLFMPFGTGFGTFDPAFRMAEPYELLRLSYLNHAHCDLLELISDGGVPAIVILLGFAFWWSRAAFGAWRAASTRSAVVLARTGSVVSGLFMLASLTDYPLRTPLAALVFAVAVYWMSARREVEAPLRG